ncbi:hypothetical protein BSL78_02127 [Apostichopus japonicus]|uniref:Uncharacterized protein n=1 Tax=Stichopus japonicus TaxID=307972 RepID=A0A2G8LL70_STIJA|nr:hypothetical protein BSL78_02127 [Apostichopus japonicus]
MSQSYSSPVYQELQDEQLCNPNDPDTDTLGEETSSSLSEDWDFLAPLLKDKGLTEDPQPKTMDDNLRQKLEQLQLSEPSEDENEEPPEVQETANLVVYLESNPADGIPEVLSEDEDKRDQELDEFYSKVSQSYSSPVCQELQDEQLCNPNDPDTDTLGEETSSSVSEDGDFLAPLLKDKGLTEDPQPKTMDENLRQKLEQLQISEPSEDENEEPPEVQETANLVMYLESNPVDGIPEGLSEDEDKRDTEFAPHVGLHTPPSLTDAENPTEGDEGYKEDRDREELDKENLSLQSSESTDESSSSGEYEPDARDELLPIEEDDANQMDKAFETLGDSQSQPEEEGAANHEEHIEWVKPVYYEEQVVEKYEEDVNYDIYLQSHEVIEYTVPLDTSAWERIKEDIEPGEEELTDEHVPKELDANQMPVDMDEDDKTVSSDDYGTEETSEGLFQKDEKQLSISEDSDPHTEHPAGDHEKLEPADNDEDSHESVVIHQVCLESRQVAFDDDSRTLPKEMETIELTLDVGFSEEINDIVDDSGGRKNEIRHDLAGQREEENTADTGDRKNVIDINKAEPTCREKTSSECSDASMDTDPKEDGEPESKDLLHLMVAKAFAPKLEANSNEDVSDPPIEPEQISDKHKGFLLALMGKKADVSPTSAVDPMNERSSNIADPEGLAENKDKNQRQLSEPSEDENEEPPEVQETANLVVYQESNPAEGIPEVLSEDEDKRDQELDEFYIKMSQSYSSPVYQELQDEQLCNPNDPDTDTLGEETSSSVSEDGDFLAPF